MTRFLIVLILLFSVPTTVAHGKEGSTAKPADFAHLQGLNNPKYHLVNAEKLKRPFHIYVRLPENYDEHEGDYPTVYLLDGGHTFPLLGSYSRLLSISGEMTDIILVGISYGSDDFRTGNLRGTDFTAPAPSREHYGGAPHFQTFLQDELIPIIEKNYRADPSRRILFGHSIGGQFVLYTAMTKPDLFWGYIASNPALHRNLPYFLDMKMSETKTGSKLFAASGSEDDARFRKPALKWVEYVSEHDELPWEFEFITLEGQTHLSAYPAAFRAGMAWIMN